MLYEDFLLASTDRAKALSVQQACPTMLPIEKGRHTAYPVRHLTSPQNFACEKFCWVAGSPATLGGPDTERRSLPSEVISESETKRTQKEPPILAWLKSDVGNSRASSARARRPHTATNGQYGFHRDELQTLSVPARDWGFVCLIRRSCPCSLDRETHLVCGPRCWISVCFRRWCQLPRW